MGEKGDACACRPGCESGGAWMLLEIPSELEFRLRCASCSSAREWPRRLACVPPSRWTSDQHQPDQGRAEQGTAREDPSPACKFKQHHVHARARFALDRRSLSRSKLTARKAVYSFLSPNRPLLIGLRSRPFGSRQTIRHPFAACTQRRLATACLPAWLLSTPQKLVVDGRLGLQ